MSAIIYHQDYTIFKTKNLCCSVDTYCQDGAGRVVLATVPDRHFGSRSGSEPNRGQIDSPGRRYTRTVNLGTVRWYTPHPSELGGLAVGHLAGPSINSYKALVFGLYLLYLTKIVFSTTNDTCLHAVQHAISINLESVFFLLYIVFLARQVVNNSVMSSMIHL